MGICCGVVKQTQRPMKIPPLIQDLFLCERTFSTARKTKSLFAAISGLALCCACQNVSAQTTSSWITETVTTGGTINWDTSGKWTPATPVSGIGTVNLNFGGLTATTSALTLRNNIGSFNVHEMTLGSASGVNITYNGTATSWVQDGSSNNPKIVLNNTGGGNNIINLNSSVASGVTLQVTGTSNRLITMGGVVSGAGGVNLNYSSGTFQATGLGTYSGNFTLTAGIVALDGSSVGSPGSVTSGPLGTGSVIINGGTIRGTGTTTARTIGNNVQIGGDFTVGAATNNPSVTLAGTTLLTGTGVTRTITGGFSGTESVNTNGLTFSGNITEAGAGNSLVFANSAATKIVLSGINTYTGNTTVNGGNMTLADNAGLKFVIGANGVNNQLAGNGTVTLGGDFTFDLSGAGTTLNDSWNIVNVASLTETFGSTFSVNGFSDIGGNLWEVTNVNGGRTYQFSEASGLLSVTAIPEPSTWALLVGGLMAVKLFCRRRQA